MVFVLAANAPGRATKSLARDCDIGYIFIVLQDRLPIDSAPTG
jgi:hypothetical protein